MLVRGEGIHSRVEGESFAGSPYRGKVFPRALHVSLRSRAWLPILRQSAARKRGGEAFAGSMALETECLAVGLMPSTSAF